MRCIPQSAKDSNSWANFCTTFVDNHEFAKAHQGTIRLSALNQVPNLIQYPNWPIAAELGESVVQADHI
jgi:hypothetical protein